MTDILEIKLDGVEQLVSATKSLSKTVESIAQLNAQLKDIYETEYERKVQLAESQRQAREKAAEAREASQPERDRIKREKEDERRKKERDRMLVRDQRLLDKKEREDKKKADKEASDALKKQIEAKKYFENLQRQSMLGRSTEYDPAKLTSLYTPAHLREQPEGEAIQPPNAGDGVSEEDNQKKEESRKTTSSLKFFTTIIKGAYTALQKFIGILEKIGSWWMKSVLAITALSEKLVHDMGISRSVGVDVQTPKYLKAAFGQVVDTDELLRGLASMRQDPTNVFYNYFKQEKGMTGNEQMDVQAIEATKFIQSIAKQNAGNLEQAYKMYGIQDTGVSMEKFRTLAQTSSEEVGEREKEYLANKRGIGEEDENKIRQFVRKFEYGLTDIETMFGKAMIRNFASLEKLGQTFMGIMTTLTSDEVFTKLINQITDAITQIAKALGTKENMENFTKWVERVTVLGENLVLALEPLVKTVLKLHDAFNWIGDWWDVQRAADKGAVDATKGIGEVYSINDEQERAFAADLIKYLMDSMGVQGESNVGTNKKMSYGMDGERESDMLVRVLSRIANQRPQGVRVEFSNAQASSNMNVQVVRVPGATGGAPFGGSGFGSSPRVVNA